MYVSKDLTEKLEALGEWIEEREREGRVIVGWNFNARTGQEERGSEKGGGRNSKDKKMDKEGNCVNILGKRGGQY